MVSRPAEPEQHPVLGRPALAALIDELADAGLVRGGLIALTLSADGLGLALPGRTWALADASPISVLAAVETAFRPRWVWWSGQTPIELTRAGLRVSSCWDLVAVHRLLFGGWQAEPGVVWAALRGLAMDSAPGMGQLDLLGAGGDEGTDPEDPVRPDGHLRPEWLSGGWRRDPVRLARWAEICLEAQAEQQRRVSSLRVSGNLAATVRSESAAELLCAELTVDGLPIDVPRAEELIASFIGPRPSSATAAAELRGRRDAAVLRLVPGSDDLDLRSPAAVRALLAKVGIDVPDTRSWRLERFRGAHPVVEAVLAWRKAERIATTYGYDWLNRNVSGGRLRGAWSGSDGAAGRMTAQAGLHNLPADLRPAVSAGPDAVFVRADLGQIEPRVLAAVSGDRALSRATQDDDLYAPVAAQLGVERPVAKIAVLAAMYGQTSGAAGEALKGMDAAYPVAMRYLREANDAGRAGRDVRTFGGRLVRMFAVARGLDRSAQQPDLRGRPGAGPGGRGVLSEVERAQIAGRGRYARNAMVQGAAAEFFKVWAAIVRARGLPLQARVVLCLHDELLVLTPAASGEAVRQLVLDCLAEAAFRWAPDPSVRFVADVSIVQRWSEAK